MPVGPTMTGTRVMVGSSVVENSHRLVNHRTSGSSRPPLWLLAAAVAAFWSAAYDVQQWVGEFMRSAVHVDFATFYVAAEAGVRHGWPSMYDTATLQSLATTHGLQHDYISSAQLFVNPPLFAWLVVPLTLLPIPAAYLAWTIVSLAALAWAWYLAAPYTGLAKLTLLLIALAIWPLLNAFFYGQPSMVIVGLVATAWWLAARGNPIAGGVALAIGTALKPQAVFLVPLAILVSGRYRLFASWAVTGAVIALATVAALGTTGLANWWHALNFLQSNPTHSHVTWAYVFGEGPIAYALEGLQGIGALVIAWRRRGHLEVVFAAGIAGSLASGFHLHAPDYATLVLAAWLVLRTAPPLWHRLWFLAALPAMQLLTLGQPVPQLIWDAAWLVIMGVSSYGGSVASAPSTQRPSASAAHAGT
jgi:hypothetical protein